MSQYSEAFVSVATPVYNCEKYLNECIDSVLSQTYRNFEYIIVNNCSTDQSPEIAKKYAEMDNRIRLYSNEELLPSLTNFNQMLRKLSPNSKYCKIVHADDWIYPECLEKMVNLAEKHPSVGIVGSYRLVNNKVELDGLPYSKTVISGHEISRMHLLDGPYTFGAPSALLIRSDLIRARDRFYNEHYLWADAMICFELLEHCDFGFVHQVLSFCREHEETISSLNAWLNIAIANDTLCFTKYGPKYLTADEYKKGIHRKMNNYYRFLGSRIFDWKNKKFWEYHRNSIKKLGFSFSWLKTLHGFLFIVLKRLADTKQNLKAFNKLI